MNEYKDRILEVYGRFKVVTQKWPPAPDVIRSDADALFFDELLKFLAIRGVIDEDRDSGFTIGMRTGPVDDLWHRWLLWTGNYAWSCKFALGHMVHHAANNPGMSPREWLDRHLAFRSAYFVCWGEVPTFWGTIEGIEDEFEKMMASR